MCLIYNEKEEKKKPQKEQNQENKTLGEKKFSYLRILEVDTIKQTEIKDKVREEYLRRTRNFSKPNST